VKRARGKARGVRPLTRADVTFVLSCEEEDTPIHGNALASGDDEADERAEREIARDLNMGNLWAWCTVIVTARYTQGGRTFEASDSLGCCSYESEAAFRADGYFDDMCESALQRLNDDIAATAASLPWEVPSAT
jgi:hypothetical protein